MATYRPIKTKVWHDDWFSHLNPEERCFWLFLLTNEYTHISGIYELPKSLISPLSGCPNSEDILERFQKEGKVIWKMGWLMIKNYIKNNSEQRSKLDNITIAIKAYLSENPFLVDWFDLKNVDTFKGLVSTLEDPPVKSKVERVKSKVKRVKKEKGFLILKDTTQFPYLLEVDFKKTLDSFLEMRHEIKKPPTNKALELLLKKLHNNPVEVAIKMLDQSTMNNWQGVFSLNDKKDQEVKRKTNVTFI
jgi:hypothetical protein